MILGEAAQGTKKTKYEKMTKASFLIRNFRAKTKEIVMEAKPAQKIIGLPMA